MCSVSELTTAMAGSHMQSHVWVGAYSKGGLFEGGLIRGLTALRRH